MERTSRLETIERGDDRTTDLRYFFHDSAAAVNAEMAAKRKELLEVRPFRDPLVCDTTSFGDDESNINQVAEHLRVEKNIAAFLLSQSIRDPGSSTARWQMTNHAHSLHDAGCLA